MKAIYTQQAPLYATTDDERCRALAKAVSRSLDSTTPRSGRNPVPAPFARAAYVGSLVFCLLILLAVVALAGARS